MNSALGNSGQQHPNRVDVEVARRLFEDAVRDHEQVHERFFMSRLLNFEFSYGQASCELRFTAEAFMLNPKGALHGGIVCLVLDSCMGHLLNHVGTPGVTLELKTQFLRAVRGGPLRARATFLEQGRRTSYLQCELRDQEDRLCAFATATWQAVATSEAIS